MTSTRHWKYKVNKRFWPMIDRAQEQGKKEILEKLEEKMWQLQDEFDNRHSLDLWNEIDETIGELKKKEL